MLNVHASTHFHVVALLKHVISPTPPVLCIWPSLPTTHVGFATLELITTTWRFEALDAGETHSSACAVCHTVQSVTALYHIQQRMPAGWAVEVLQHCLVS